MCAVMFKHFIRLASWIIVTDKPVIILALFYIVKKPRFLARTAVKTHHVYAVEFSLSSRLLYGAGC